MTEPLVRDDIIALLNSLGSEDEQEALAAAREAHAKVTAAGVSWESLLIPDSDAESEEPQLDDEDLEDEADEEEEAVVLPGSAEEKNAEALALIGKLLAKKDISEDFREELEDYKVDIAEGEFTEADHRYIRAVFKRLKV